MKKWTYFLGIAVLALSCQREAGFRISGSVPGTPDGMKAYLYDGDTPVDSAVVKGGKFVIKGKVDIPARYQLWIDLSPDKVDNFEKDMRGSDIFVDNSDIRYESPSIDSLASMLRFKRKVNGNVAITGSPVHDLYMSYKGKIEPYSARKREAWDKYLKAYHVPALDGVFNTQEGIALTREMQEAQKGMEQIQWEFIKANPTSPVAVDAARDIAARAKLTKVEMNDLLQAIDPSLREIPVYKQLKKNLENLYPIAIGEKYTDIEVVDGNGKTVHLSDFVKLGQYNMVEFWASWCGPCRGEIPHLRHVYDAYGKGKDAFNMISVSIDDKEKDWKQALKEENMNWTQLCDMKGWKGDVINKYKINGVPFCLILDKEGRIIEYGVRGSALDIVLIDHLGNRYKE